LLTRHLGDVPVLAIANRDKWKGRVVVTLSVVTSRNSALWLAQLLCAELTLRAEKAADDIKDGSADTSEK
jgi:hypothetical protein